MYEEQTPQNEVQHYISEFDQAFQARLDSFLGDGIVCGLNEEKQNHRKTGQNTIKIMYQNEPHYFLFIGNLHIVLVHESSLDTYNENYDVLLDKNDPTALYAFKQLLNNPWIEEPRLDKYH